MQRGFFCLHHRYLASVLCLACGFLHTKTARCQQAVLEGLELRHQPLVLLEEYGLSQKADRVDSHGISRDLFDSGLLGYELP